MDAHDPPRRPAHEIRADALAMLLEQLAAQRKRWGQAMSGSLVSESVLGPPEDLVAEDVPAPAARVRPPTEPRRPLPRWDGLSFEELAAKYDVSVSTLRARWQAGRRGPRLVDPNSRAKAWS